MFQQIMMVISAVLSVYSMLLVFRILLTWFRGVEMGRLPEYLGKITDPYLNLFRRFSFLRVGYLDLSPLVAITVLYLLTNITSRLALQGQVTLGYILAIILISIWNVISWFFILFLIIFVVRLVMILFNASTVHPAVQALDNLIQPVLSWIVDTVLRGRTVTYVNGLLIGAAGFLVIKLLGDQLFGYLASLLASLPI